MWRQWSGNANVSLLWWAVAALHPVYASDTPMPRDCRSNGKGCFTAEPSRLRRTLVIVAAYALRVDKAMHDKDYKPFTTLSIRAYDNILRTWTSQTKAFLPL